MAALVIQPNLHTSANRSSRENKDNDGDKSDDLAVRKFDIHPPQSASIHFPDDEKYKKQMTKGNNQ